MVKPDIQNMQGFISLKEAAKIYGYTVHHFGLLCRSGKLKSERIGKKWLVKKEWIDEYLKEVEAFYKNGNHHYINGSEKVSVIVKKPAEIIPEIRLQAEKPKPDFSLPGQLVFKLGLGALVMVFMMYSSSPVLNFSATAFLSSTKNNAADFLYDFESLGNRLIEAGGGINLAKIDSINSAEIKNSFVSRFSFFCRSTENNFYAFLDDLKYAGQKIKNFARGLGKKFVFAPKEAPDEAKPPAGGLASDSDYAEPAARDGLVVVPKAGEADTEKTIKMIKDSFSDEVLVTPGEDGDSGIIQPVFKTGKGDEYIYVMVPAKEISNPKSQ